MDRQNGSVERILDKPDSMLAKYKIDDDKEEESKNECQKLHKTITELTSKNTELSCQLTITKQEFLNVEDEYSSERERFTAEIKQTETILKQYIEALDRLENESKAVRADNERLKTDFRKESVKRESAEKIIQKITRERDEARRLSSTLMPELTSDQKLKKAMEEVEILSEQLAKQKEKNQLLEQQVAELQDEVRKLRDRQWMQDLQQEKERLQDQLSQFQGLQDTYQTVREQCAALEKKLEEGGFGFVARPWPPPPPPQLDPVELRFPGQKRREDMSENHDRRKAICIKSPEETVEQLRMQGSVTDEENWQQSKESSKIPGLPDGQRDTVRTTPPELTRPGKPRFMSEPTQKPAADCESDPSSRGEAVSSQRANLRPLPPKPVALDVGVSTAGHRSVDDIFSDMQIKAHQETSADKSGSERSVSEPGSIFTHSSSGVNCLRVSQLKSSDCVPPSNEHKQISRDDFKDPSRSYESILRPPTVDDKRTTYSYDENRNSSEQIHSESSSGSVPCGSPLQSCGSTLGVRTVNDKRKSSSYDEKTNSSELNPNGSIQRMDIDLKMPSTELSAREDNKFAGEPVNSQHSSICSDPNESENFDD